ncbi:hypothetical protein, partial [Lactobacillus delbrueckii]|uniref:hypothetical protein n=2 Tax=Lactobacillus delbrueckii TaxID=1584 RepID=UPI0021A2781D
VVEYFGSQLSLLVSSSRVERIVKDEAIGTLVRTLLLVFNDSKTSHSSGTLFDIVGDSVDLIISQTPVRCTPHPSNNRMGVISVLGLFTVCLQTLDT